MAKSPMAPARMVGRAVGPLRLGGMTMSGLVTSRMWHPAAKTAALSASSNPTRRERRRSRCCVLSILGVMAWGPRRLKGDIDAADEVPHRRLGQEVRRREVVLTCLVELGIHALVVRPRGEVATRDADAEGGGAELPGPLLGGEVGDRYLAQLGEAAVFDVAGLRAFEVGDGRSLINERRSLVVQGAAVVARRQAAELLGTVEQLVAVAAIEQRIQPDAPQDRHVGRQGAAMIGERLSLEHRRRSEGHLARVA